ncbi:helix-turn-helix domain-containing protein [Bacillus badius]|uniref:helix-turn-helix transcriptional regulator n=1 Tax=Bacillus badius TaxID=1455 RepID=UPI001CBB0DED|nr:helix-turn-helix transcriptional regulator [Bacillus badius]UAT29393.1 helix-turn-helix domain-containing protein [Bacillus badius]
MEPRIKKLIEGSKYKRDYIRKELGISPNTLRNWSNGETEPTYTQARKLAELLEVPMEELYEETKKDPPT